MRFNNFSEIKTLCEFVVTNKDESRILKEIASCIWEDKATDQIRNQYKLVFDHYLKQTPESGFEFKDKLQFEFFYSLEFINNDLLHSGKSLANIAELVWHKVYRQKSKNGLIKLSSDFPAICLINIHNYFKVGILNAVTEEFDSCFQKLAWDFSKALPYFSSSSENVYTFLTFLFLKEGNKFIPGVANGISELCSVQSEIGIDLLQKVDDDTNEKIKGITPAIINGLTKSKGSAFTLPLIIQKLKSSREYDVRNGLFILANFNMTEADWSTFGNSIKNQIEIIEKSTNEAHKVMLPAIYVQFINFITLARESLIQYSESDNQQHQVAMSEIAWLKASDFYSEPWYETVVVNGAVWDYSNTDIANNMGFCLLTLVEKTPVFALKFLNTWIANKNNPIEKLEIFKNDITTLFGNNRELMQEWMTTSLKSSDERFHLAVRLIISNLWINGLRHFSLDKELINSFSFWEIKYILFKILGYVDTKDALESLTFSLLEKEPFDSAVVQLVTNAFTQHICYNYGGAYSFLKEKIPTATVEIKAVIQAILDAGEKYFQHTRKIRNINELKWQKKIGKSFNQIRMKKMSDDFKEGMKKQEKNSIRSLFKNISMKGGRKFFSKYEGIYTAPTPLQSMGDSFELPMAELIDPVKEVINRIEWRNYQMNS